MRIPCRGEGQKSFRFKSGRIAESGYSIKMLVVHVAFAGFASLLERFQALD